MGKSLSEGKEKEDIKKALENMNVKLAGKKYLAGDTITLVDASAIFNIMLLDAIPSFDMSPYPNVQRWSETMRKLPEFKEVNEGFEAFVKLKVGK